MRQTPTDYKPHQRGGQPLGTLQDAGELAVLTPNQGAVRHRHALVVSFTSETELRRALKHLQCAYRQGKDIQEQIHNG